MKPLKDRNFYKILRACDAISDCMDDDLGIIKDFKQLEEQLKEIFE
ncbi:MAG: hypothetical protein ACW98A_17735 [Candidatus Hodarchaeales archaeon]